MIYLGNGIYFDTQEMIVFQLQGDGRRPSILFDGTESDTTTINDVKISVM